MAGRRRRSPRMGTLLVLSCHWLSLVDGFRVPAAARAAPSPSPKRFVPTATRAKTADEGEGCDPYYDVCVDEHAPPSPFQLSRRSAIAVAAIAPLSNLAAPSNALPLPSEIPHWTLDGGVEFPLLALNTAGMTKEETYHAVELAREEGMTHVDFHPGDERDGVAKYLSKSKRTGAVGKGKRDDLFLTTKIRKAPVGTSPADAAAMALDQINEDLRILNADRVDMLMLRDNSDPAVIRSQWKVVEEALAEGRTRSVGVVNYCPSALEAVLDGAKVVPAVNYIMVHAGMGKDAHGLRTLGEKAGIRTFTYGQTGEPRPNAALLSSRILKRIGKAHGKSTEEVALRWVLQNGMAASVRPSLSFGTCVGKGCRLGIERQARCFEWSLTEGEMEQLDAMTSPDDNPTLFSSAGCPGAFGTLIIHSHAGKDSVRRNDTRIPQVEQVKQQIQSQSPLVKFLLMLGDELVAFSRHVSVRDDVVAPNEPVPQFHEFFLAIRDILELVEELRAHLVQPLVVLPAVRVFRPLSACHGEVGPSVKVLADGDGITREICRYRGCGGVAGLECKKAFVPRCGVEGFSLVVLAFNEGYC
ncbi:hypothetical protein ACHAWF_004794 [Thalassiosira exigua]